MSAGTKLNITGLYESQFLTMCWSDVVRFIMLLDLIPHIVSFFLEGFKKSF